MNVESILKEKGTEVATISPEATIKIGADWLAHSQRTSVLWWSGKTLLWV